MVWRGSHRNVQRVRLAFRGCGDATISEAAGADQRFEFIDRLEKLAHVLAGVLEISGDATRISNGVGR